MSLCSNSHQKAASPASSCHLVCCPLTALAVPRLLRRIRTPHRAEDFQHARPEPARVAVKTDSDRAWLGPAAATEQACCVAACTRLQAYLKAYLAHSIACPLPPLFWQAGGVASYFDYSPISLLGAN